MPKGIRNPKTEGRRLRRWSEARLARFGIRASGFFRISDFEFRSWSIALFLTLALTALAAEPPEAKPTFHASLRAASDAATADQSLVLLIFGADWCAPCKQLKSQTLDSPEFREQGGVVHIAEVDVDANAKTARDFAVEAVPTLVLLTGDGKIVTRQTGFVRTAELLLWLQEGRRRAKAGQWEGTVPGSKLDELTAKAAAGNLSSNDLRRVVALLGEADPADRTAAGNLLLGQREAAVVPLIEATGDEYLGVRLNAGDLLHRLAPDAPVADPWQLPEERSNTVAALKNWWADTGKLPPSAAPRPGDASFEASIKEALDDLRGEDPVRRTEAMTTLAGNGPAALPAVREALKRAERTGDQRSLVLLEDVRWAILVPDTLEQRAAGVRGALARGRSSERQAAAERLTRGSREALPALSELVNDADPLVVESAVRALSGIGGKDAIPAMAALLNAADGNLRMTAAQALGHTRNSDAIKPLLTVCDDPNEIVACTALAAIEEIRSRESSRPARGSLPDEITAGLRRCLGDSRWRVRATAAEIAGKLSAANLVPDLKKLLDDPDGFVVKNTLAALKSLNAAPGATRLAELGKRLPSLRGDIVELMLESESTTMVQSVTEMFNTSGPDVQVTILNALAQHESLDDNRTDNGWKPLFTQAATATDPRLRSAAATALASRSPKLAAELVGPLLADEDRDTRKAAAEVVLILLTRDAEPGLSTRSSFISGTSVSSFLPLRVEGRPTETRQPIATPERRKAWHEAMVQRAGPAPPFAVAAAVFATGDGKSDLPLLEAALDKFEFKGLRQQQGDLMAVMLVISKLPWPESRPVLDRLSASPVLFALAVQRSGRTNAALADYLLEPARFKTVMERASGDELTGVLGLLVGYSFGDERQPWSLLATDERTKAVVSALVSSTNAGLRAASIYALGLRPAGSSSAIFEKALDDPDPWVRAAAVQAVTRSTRDRPALETRLGPLLAETNLQVAAKAALALLQPEVRRAAGLEAEDQYFVFEGNTIGGSVVSSTTDDRPLTPLEDKPAFLPLARERLAGSSGFEAAPFALLLAQYGEFDGIDRLLAQNAGSGRGSEIEATSVVLTGIALSRDAKYLPALQRMTAATSAEWELRKILQALRGLTGPDVRQLRLEVNKRIREAADSAGTPILD